MIRSCGSILFFVFIMFALNFILPQTACASVGCGSDIKCAIRYSYGISSSEVTDDVLDLLLQTKPDFMANGSTYLDAFRWTFAIEDILVAVNNQDYTKAIEVAAAKSAEEAATLMLSSSFIGNTVLSVWGFVNIATLPIGWSINKFIEGVNKTSANNQFKIYFAARNAGYNHENIINQQSRDDVAVIIYEDGWIRILENYVNTIWQSAPPTDIAPAEFYEKARIIYDAIQVSGQFYADKQTIGNEFEELLYPRIICTPESPIAPSDITFHVSGKVIESRNITSWNWAFGDGGSSNQSTPTHFYHDPGNYPVTVTLIDDTEQTHQVSTTVSVLLPPIMVEYPDGYESLYRHFSTPVNTQYKSYVWNFGDGTIRTDDNDTTSHTYATSGYYTISLTITLQDDTSITSEAGIFVGPGTRYIQSHTIYGHETWYAGGTYVVQGPITVANGGRLTIEPGVEVQMSGGSWLSVSGTLTATGVTFTWADGVNPWNGLMFSGAGASGSRLENCVIEHTRGNNRGYGSELETIYILQSSPSLIGCTVRDSRANEGIRIDNASSPLISNCTIESVKSGAGQGIVVYDFSAAEMSTPTVTGTTITGCFYGIQVSSYSNGTYQGNTFNGNSNYGLLYYGSNILNAKNNYWGHSSGPLDSSDDRASGGWYNPLGQGNKVSDRVNYLPWGVSANPNAVDSDGDGLVDGLDNCPAVSNSDQVDASSNGIGDACDDSDADGDGLTDREEWVYGTNPAVADQDFDQTPDGADSNPFDVSVTGAAPTPLNDDVEFVRQVYRDFLNREADPGGLTYWAGELTAGRLTRAAIVENSLLSPEFGEKVAPVTRLYFAYFRRIPDYSGLMYWVGEYGAGRRTLDNISDFFASSPEFQATYGNLSNEQFMTLVYQNVLGRDPEPGGYTFWTNELNTGSRTRGQVMAGFSESAEYQSLMANKIYVTMTYIGLLRRAPEQGGFDYWVSQMDQGASGQILIGLFLGSQEYTARFDGSTWTTPMVSYAFPYQWQTVVEDEDNNGDLVVDTQYATTYTYNANNVLTQTVETYDYGGDSTVNATITTSYSYDGNGNLQTVIRSNDWNNDTVVDSLWTTTYETDAYGNVLHRYESKDYDADGTPEIVLPTLYTWSGDGLLNEQVTAVDGNDDGIADRVESIRYSYNASGQLTTIRAERDSQNDGVPESLVDETLTWDGSNRIVSWAEAVDSNGDTLVDRLEMTTFQYDQSGKLTAANTSIDSDANGSIDDVRTISLAYDGSGNLTFMSEKDDSGNNGAPEYILESTMTYTTLGMPTGLLPRTANKPVFLPVNISLLRK